MKFYLVIIALVSLTSACAPTVSLQTPDKPLEINLNVKVDHQISVKIDRELEQVMKNNDDIF